MGTTYTVWYNPTEGEWNVSEGQDTTSTVYISFDLEDCLDYIKGAEL